MALAETVLRTQPVYWTAAVYKSSAGGVFFQRYLPAVKESWASFLRRRMALGLGYQTMPFYWDGSRWVNDKSGNDVAFMRVGAEAQDFVTIFPGWNVWAVWAVKSPSFDPLMIGVSPERRLRIWVEDQVRLHASGAVVADPLDLKGGQVELLPSEASTEGLTVKGRKEETGGPALTVDGPAELHFIRFFNRGAEAKLPWPHDEDYLLDRYYQPSTSAPATQGPGPSTMTNTVVQPATDALKPVFWGAGILAAFLLIREFKK